MHPVIWKNTHSTFCGVFSWHFFLFFFSFFPLLTEFGSPFPPYLISQILGVWLLLLKGMGDQLNIYGSTSIQMFANGESLWPENWHDLFVHNMQQGTWRASPQHVSVWVCFVVAVLADDVIVMDIFVGCGLLESHIISLTRRGEFLFGAGRPKEKSGPNFRADEINI